MRIIGALALAAVAFGAARPAAANDEWYGWQPVLADVTAAACVGVSVAADAGPPAVACTAGFVVAAPIIHAAHGQYTDAGISLGLRLAPWAIGYAIARSGPHGDRHAGINNTLSGIFFGVLLSGIAAVVDDAFLSDEPGPKAPVPVMFSIGRSF